VKFLCDRCKTRYSIGDDRVRGKILKIRCKNCANVITVREGMSVEESAPADRGRPTTAAPMAAAATPAGRGGALASAFASQLAKPPPALEEEWYVSIDGDQAGPYSLSDAQRWITSKAIDADVHCWSEGFDDWLPVDKVSHFRGLRKRATPPVAPPMRRSPGRSGPAARPTPAATLHDEEEPKPLFAATMASIEKDAGISPSSPATPANGVLAKANGTGSKPVPRIPAIPSPEGSSPVNKSSTGPNRSSTVQGLGGQQSAGAKALSAAFETSEKAASPHGESLTMVDSPAYNDDVVTAAEPSAAKRAFDAALDKRAAENAAENAEDSSNGAPPDFDDDSMEIGEVSRVVKLADLAKMANQPRKARTPVANPIALRATGSAPKIDGATLAMVDAAKAAAPDAPIEPVAAPIVAQVHRRGLIMLVGIAAVLLIGVAALVIVMVQKNGDDTVGGLGTKRQIDTSRPDELVFHTTNDQGSAPLIPKPNLPRNPVNRPTPPKVGSGDDSAGGEAKGDKLKGEEIEAMANKNATGTQRCYMRAQRGAEGIEIADLKKLSVTLNIGKDGTVTDVTLSDHGTDSLGTCLIGQIKRWKFRESPGGLVRITLAFAQ